MKRNLFPEVVSLMSFVFLVGVVLPLSGDFQREKKSPDVTGTPLVKSPNLAYQSVKQDAEEKILTALNKNVKLKFDKTPLKEVVRTIGELLKVPVLMDEIAISDEGLKFDQPITFESSDITARSALNVMLEPLELTWHIQDEVLVVSSETAAEEEWSTRAFDVTDLVEKIEVCANNGYEPCQKCWDLMETNDPNRKRPTLVKMPECRPIQVNDFDPLVEVLEHGTGYCWGWCEGLNGSITEFENHRANRQLILVRYHQRAIRDIESLVFNIREKVHGPDSVKAKEITQNANWKYERTCNKAEQKLLEALNEAIEVNFIETPLSEVANFFGKKLGVPVYLNEKAIKEEGLNIDEPITFKLKNTTVRSALRFVLNRLELVWLPRNECLYITSYTEADDLMLTTVHDVTDLVPIQKIRWDEIPSDGSGFYQISDGGWNSGYPPVNYPPDKKVPYAYFRGIAELFDDLIETWHRDELRTFEHVGQKKRLLIIRTPYHKHLEIEEILNDLRVSSRTAK